MTSDPDQHRLTGTPTAPPSEPHWEQRLGVALVSEVLVLGVLLRIADGGLFGIRLSGVLKRLAEIGVVVGLVLFMLTGTILIVRESRRLPPPHRLLTWGTSLIIAGLFPFMLVVLWIYVDVSGLLPGWHPSSMQLVVAVLLLATGILWSIGVILIYVASIRAVRRLARVRRAQPPATPNV